MAQKKGRPTSRRTYTERQVVPNKVSRTSRSSVGEKEREEDGQDSAKQNYTQILKGLYQLSHEELESVISAAKYIISQQSEEVEIDNTELKPFYDALIQVVKEKGTTVRNPQSYYVFVRNEKNTNLKWINEQKHEIDEWIKKYAGSLRRTEQFAFYRFAWHCLLLWLEKEGMSRGPKTALRNIDQIPEAVDDQLPGYIKSGVLKAVIKKHKKQQTEVE